jgi:hypothetical protein
VGSVAGARGGSFVVAQAGTCAFWLRGGSGQPLGPRPWIDRVCGRFIAVLVGK